MPRFGVRAPPAERDLMGMIPQAEFGHSRSREMPTCPLHGSPEGTDGVNSAWSLAKAPAGRHRGISGVPLSTYKARLMPPASSCTLRDRRGWIHSPGQPGRLPARDLCPGPARQPRERQARSLLAGGARGGVHLGTAPPPQPQPRLGLSPERGRGGSSSSSSSWSALPSLGRRTALQRPAGRDGCGQSPRAPGGQGMAGDRLEEPRQKKG